MYKPVVVKVGMSFTNCGNDPARQRYGDDLFEVKQFRAQAVVDVVGVIGDVVGHGGDLGFSAGETPELQVLRAAIIENGCRNAVSPIVLKRRAGAVGERTIVLDQALERFPGQIQAVEGWIALLQYRHYAERLSIVIEAADCRQAGIECALSGVAEWRMAEVVRKRQRLGQVLIEPQPPGQRSRNLRDLERMGQPSAIMVALVRNKNLGL